MNRSKQGFTDLKNRGENAQQYLDRTLTRVKDALYATCGIVSVIDHYAGTVYIGFEGENRCAVNVLTGVRDGILQHGIFAQLGVNEPLEGHTVLTAMYDYEQAVAQDKLNRSR